MSEIKYQLYLDIRHSCLTLSRKSPPLSRQGESGGLGLPCFSGK